MSDPSDPKTNDHFINRYGDTFRIYYRGGSVVRCQMWRGIYSFGVREIPIAAWRNMVVDDGISAATSEKT